MSRGGRRRRRPQGEQDQGADKQGEGQAAPDERTTPAASAKAGDAAPGRRRRRRRGRDGRPGGSQETPSRPRRATTLPPDGVVLEEVIASMQSEYGTPTTPQEYRLLVRVGGRESHAEEGQAASGQEPQASRSQPGQAEGATPGRRTRLRRRPRRPGAKQRAGESGAGESESGGPTGSPPSAE